MRTITQKKVLETILTIYKDTKSKDISGNWDVIPEDIHNDFDRYTEILVRNGIIQNQPAYCALDGWFVTLTDWAIHKLETP